MDPAGQYTACRSSGRAEAQGEGHPQNTRLLILHNPCTLSQRVPPSTALKPRDNRKFRWRITKTRKAHQPGYTADGAPPVNPFPEHPKRYYPSPWPHAKPSSASVSGAVKIKKLMVQGNSAQKSCRRPSLDELGVAIECDPVLPDVSLLIGTCALPVRLQNVSRFI